MANNDSTGNLLGRDTDYPRRYNPELLQPVARNLSRQLLGSSVPQFSGVDIWTAYELSWLSNTGKPQVAIAEFVFPASSPAIIESKSFKYYLNSLNQHCFGSREALLNTLQQDLSRACGESIEVGLFDVDDYRQAGSFPGLCVDNLEASRYGYSPDSSLLAFSSVNTVSGVELHSHLLKSNCPVTGQPDWASVYVSYSGRELVPESFLAYVVSFREHQGFHENCVERIFTDLWQSGELLSLCVYARYTRRGGLDINPYRVSSDRAERPDDALMGLRGARQ